MSTSQNPPPNPALARIHERLSRFITNECRQKALSFVPRASDVFVVTPPKCGTTWMQQILHQLRSGGDMTFADIDEEVPWIDVAYDCGQDLDAEHKYQPRCFKTHAWYGGCPKGAKYIVIYREPCAAFYSFYNFFQHKYFQQGELTIDEFVKSFCLINTKPKNSTDRANYFDHLLSWWPHRNDPNVLFLTYEDMLEDLETTVRKVASLMGIDDDAHIKSAVEMSRFDFMKQHGDKFATRLLSSYRNKAMGIPEGIASDRVVTGSATKGREMMEECTKKAVQKMWDEIVASEIGFRDYNEFRNALKKLKHSAS